MYGIPIPKYIVADYNLPIPGCDSSLHRYPEIVNKLIICETCFELVNPKEAKWIVKKHLHIPYCSDECMVASEI